MAFKSLRAALLKAKSRTKRILWFDLVSMTKADRSSSRYKVVEDIDVKKEDSIKTMDASDMSMPSSSTLSSKPSSSASLSSLSVTASDIEISSSTKMVKVKSVSFDETRNKFYLDDDNSYIENSDVLWYTADELGAMERQNVAIWTDKGAAQEIMEVDIPRGLERLTEPYNYYRSRQRARQSRKLIIREQRREKRWKREPDWNKLADYYKTLGTTESLKEAHARGLEDYVSTLNLCNFE